MCQGCNSGWLSDLETTAQAIVGALVRGRGAILDGEKQRTVATWAYKTVLLFQMLVPSSFGPCRSLDTASSTEFAGRLRTSAYGLL